MTESLMNGLVWLIDKFFSVFRDFVFYHFDLVLEFVEGVIDKIPVPEFLQNAHLVWNQLPPQMVYILDKIGIFTALSILGGALLIRLRMKLLPSFFFKS